ncbi:hypothetical protein CSOJ01_14954 [Colletotrichum sojae]|uniref:Uncharacterized protein n=1 Tax=Colletotrichum sojae TaxID=2175907 RepID=A0A8H6INN5_9PEZI|nr:hypothetical protein CSOJ01_14954 [Colletotrichum sojae]
MAPYHLHADLQPLFPGLKMIEDVDFVANGNLDELILLSMQLKANAAANGPRAAPPEGKMQEYREVMADRLVAAISQGYLPSDPDTCRHYGFNDCGNAANAHRLFGAYTTLIKSLNVAAHDLAMWEPQQGEKNLGTVILTKLRRKEKNSIREIRRRQG